MCLWLVHYAVILAAAMMIAMRSSPEVSWQITKGRRVLLAVGLTAMLLTIAGIFLLAPDRKLFFRVLGMILAAGLIFAALWVPLSRKRGWLKESE